MSPSECVADVLVGVNEKRDATSRSLTSHYERSSEWLTEAIQTCKRKILEGTGQEVAEPKRLKKTTDKENIAVNNVKKSAVKAEKKAKKAVPASAKKASVKKGGEVHPPGYLRVMSMKVIGLRTELRRRNLDTTGLKKDLQKRLLKAISVEESKKQESQSVSKSAAKAKKPTASSVKDGDGDVRMKDAEASNGSDACCDSSKMDVDEDDARRMKGASAVKASAKKGAVKETTVAKSFLKNTAELFSPSKIAAKMHSVKKEETVVETSSTVAKETNEKPEATKPGRNSLTDGLKKTASAILSASPVRKAPVSQSSKSPYSKGNAVKTKAVAKAQEAPAKEASSDQSLEQLKSSSESSSEPKNQSLNAASVPAISNKLGSIDKNAGAATKAKRNKATADRMARLAEIRGKSKPVASSSKSGAVKDLPVLSSSKALKLGSAKAKDSKNNRKLLLTAQMREKAAAGSKTHVPAKVPPSSSKPLPSQTKSESAKVPTNVVKAATATQVAACAQSQSAPNITASPSVVVQMKQVAPTSSAKSVKASSSKKKAAPRPDVLSPMSTYEMSDREQSDTDDSDSESHHHRQKKKVPKWAQKHNLLPALENQYANRDGRLDPETIFPPVATCNLEDIFDQKKSRYNRRTSSANWSKDGVTVNEIVAYKRTMGY